VGSWELGMWLSGRVLAYHLPSVRPSGSIPNTVNTTAKTNKTKTLEKPFDLKIVFLLLPVG
jgi:hypothetical protein